MSSKKEDLRVVKTKMAIKNAFMQLLKEKPFEKITVADITEKALIHRGTFYSHYTDKFDLLDAIQEDIIDDMSQFVELIDDAFIYKACADNMPLPHIVPVLTYIEEHSEYYMLIMQSNNRGFFEKLFDRYFEQVMISTNWPDDKWIDYRKDIAQSVITAVLNRWVNGGMKETKEELASWMTGIMLSYWNVEG